LRRPGHGSSTKPAIRRATNANAFGSVPK
jgi:hypothetical protein